MFDQEAHAYAYEHDTEVVDVEEPPLVLLPRVPTEELAVHVIVNGERHRRHTSTTKTSCGIAFHTQFCPPLREELTHPLSRTCGCFTRAELAEADHKESVKFEGPLSTDKP